MKLNFIHYFQPSVVATHETQLTLPKKKKQTRAQEASNFLISFRIETNIIGLSHLS